MVSSMHAATPASPRICFEEFEADLQTQELLRSGRRVRLPNQSFIVLAMLLQKPGQLVTREDLRKALWPKDTYVEYDQALNAAVNRLREALRDSADSPRYIETLPRRGYRFIAAIQPSADPTPAMAATSPIPPTSQPNRRWLAVGAALVAVFAAAWILPRTFQSPRAAATLTPFTSLPDREIAPTFSPTGNELAFAWNGARANSPGFHLQVKSLDSERVLQFTHRPATWLVPAWSHDGKQIAFARSAGADSGIFVVPALGGEERRLLNATIPAGDLAQVAWSADDKELLYTGTGPSGANALYRLPLESLQPVLLELPVDCWDAGAGTYSPDGRNIAFVCTRSIAVYSIHTMRADGTHLRKRADVQGYPKGIAWAADGKRIVFANDSGDGGGLWQVDEDGNVSRMAFGEEASAPASARRGNRLAYVRNREAIDIWRVDLAAAVPEQSATRFIFSTRVQMLPQYSPDGRYIAFQSNRSGSTEIWVVAADGSNPVRVSSFNGPLTGAPTWCSDSKRLAFDSRAPGISALYIADIEQRLPRRVDASIENLALPAWAADCTSLLASDGNQQSYLISLASGTAQRFTAHPSYYSSINGDRVVFNVKAVGGVTLWQKQLGGTAEKPLDGMPLLSYSDSWTATGNGIYFTQVSDDPRLVRFYDFATRQVRAVVRLAKSPAAFGGLGLSVSPDGRYLLYTQVAEHESDIVLLTY
jgi:Tol biopolymer transport system component/DNA-binding winged helix-turn-helix (wHTH) protein